MGEGEFLHVAVAHLHAPAFHARFVRIYAKPHKQNLEQVLCRNLIGGDDGSIDKEGHVLVLVGEHQVGVVVLLGNAVPEMPEGVFYGPTVT